VLILRPEGRGTEEDTMRTIYDTTYCKRCNREIDLVETVEGIAPMRRTVVRWLDDGNYENTCRHEPK
jgi:hypothetical protein